jgi:hypothetical protein
MCVTSLGWGYEKLRKSDVSVRDSFKINVSQRGLESHRPPWYRSTVSNLRHINISFLRVPSGRAQIISSMTGRIFS